MTLLAERPTTTVVAQPLTNRALVRVLLAAAAFGAGVIHLAFAPEHLEEYLPLGIGFILSGVLQILWGLVLSVRESRRLLIAGGAFSLLFLGVYVMSRTVGLPLGPGAFQPEALGRADLLCCALEVPVAFASLALSRRTAALRAPIAGSWLLAGAVGLLLIGASTTSALAAPAHEHVHVSCPSTPVLTGTLNEQGVDTGVTAYFSCTLLHEHDHAGHGHE